MKLRLLLLVGSCFSAAPSVGLAQTAADAPITASEAQLMRAEIAELRAQVEALKVAQTKVAASVQAAPPLPSWKGAPQFSSGESGFTFKPRGQVQVDVGFISSPGSAGGAVGPVTGTFGAAGVNTTNLGFNTRLRRINVGAEGSLPGGFGYLVEFELSQSSVNYEDVILTYQAKGSPLQLRIGYQYPLQSLDQIAGSKFTSFMERAGNTDAFGNSRRIGIAGTWAKGDLTLSTGLFGEDVANINFARTGWETAARATWSPKLDATQLHLGLNLQHRVAPRDAQNVRLRQRPYLQLTDQRFIDTGRIAADGDDIAGVELGAIAKSLHFAGEAQWLRVRGFNDPARAFGANRGTGGTSAFLASDPTFFSGYVELGYFFTGETRGYKGGRWDRTSVLRPFNKGGWGALQANIRLDHTDFQDRVGAGAITPGSAQLCERWRPDRL